MSSCFKGWKLENLLQGRSIGVSGCSPWPAGSNTERTRNLGSLVAVTGQGFPNRIQLNQAWLQKYKVLQSKWSTKLDKFISFDKSLVLVLPGSLRAASELQLMSQPSFVRMSLDCRKETALPGIGAYHFHNRDITKLTQTSGGTYFRYIHAFWLQATRKVRILANIPKQVPEQSRTHQISAQLKLSFRFPSFTR